VAVYKFKLEVSVEARDAKEARITAIEKMLDALNDPEVLELVKVGTRSER